MNVFDNWPAVVVLCARKAFILVLTEHGVNAPMSEIIAGTIIQGEKGDSAYVEVLWREGLSHTANAMGRFYPDSTSGGVMFLDFLYLNSKEVQRKAEKYTFSVTADNCFQLTVAP